jgi:hypothetical protein
MEAACSFKMSLIFYQNIWHDIPNDFMPHTCRIIFFSVIMCGTMDSRSMENEKCSKQILPITPEKYSAEIQTVAM